VACDPRPLPSRVLIALIVALAVCAVRAPLAAAQVVDFGTVPLGSSATFTLDVEVANCTDQHTFTISGPQAADFSVTSTGVCFTDINGKSAINVTLRFRPLGCGPRQADLVVTTARAGTVIDVERIPLRGVGECGAPAGTGGGGPSCTGGSVGACPVVAGGHDPKKQKKRKKKPRRRR
jgi:hypothetical protein